MGIELIATDDMIDSTKASGHLFLNVSGSINQYYSEVTCERVKLTKSRKMEKLEYVGGEPPLGWQISKKLNKDGKKMLEPRVEELEVLEVMEDLHNHGNGIRQIAKELERRHFKNRQGKYTWSSKTVWMAIQSGFGKKSP